MPIAAPAGALSSAWYCAGATASGEGQAEGTIIVSNPRPVPVRGTVTFVAEDPRSPPARLAFQVGGRDRKVFSHHDHIRSAYAAGLVELEGGEVGVEHSVSGPLGADVAPCATAPSDRWYFADGGTTRDAKDVLALFNPFPEDAIVDLSFTTDQGQEEPPGLQGVVVPGGRLVTIDVGASVLRRRAVSTTVLARLGRLIVDRIQTYDGSDRRKGLALVPGTPSSGALWYFPDGFISDGIVERYQVYNPSSSEAHVSLQVGLDEGEAEPLELVVPAGGRVTLKANDERRIRKNIGHWATLRSDNQVGVVAERSVDAEPPAGRSGLASTMGARSTARRWLFAAGVVQPALEEWVIVHNPGPRSAVLLFTAVGAGRAYSIPGLRALPLEAGRRAAVRLGDHLSDPNVFVTLTSTEPVVAERGLYRVGKIGISLVPGIPLR